MNLLAGFIAQVLHLALIAVAVPAITGAASWLQARLAGRRGPPFLQPWHDLRRLLRKQVVVAESASPVTEAGPTVCLAGIAVAASLVPSFSLGMIFAPFADLVVIAGLLSVARAALALAAMDAGVALGGVGASRVMLLGCGSEAALLLAVFVLALLASSSNIDAIAATLRDSETVWPTGALLATAAVVLVALIDGDMLRRETTALELAGIDLALIEIAGGLRLLVWFNLIGAVLLPFGMADADAGPVSWLIGLASWLVRTALFTAATATLRAAHGRLRLSRALGMVGVAMLLGLLGMIVLLARMRTA
jgi:formate hydrogenlyase subunit 4